MPNDRRPSVPTDDHADSHTNATKPRHRGKGKKLKNVNKKRNEVVFCIPYPPTKKGKAAWNKRFGLNAYWSGKHFKARSQDARDIHDMTWIALKKAKVRKETFQEPVEVHFYWDDRQDIDNHAALGKMIVDSLKGYILKDDSPRWFRKVTHEFWPGDCIKVVVRPHKEVNNCDD